MQIYSGKARRGDGNDLTANPAKLAKIGKELEKLGKEINLMTPVSEVPFPTRLAFSDTSFDRNY